MKLASLLFVFTLAQAQPVVTSVATNLANPRGVVVLSETELVVVEAGDGKLTEAKGKISIFSDLNADGDFDDAAERRAILSGIPSYNGLTMFGTGHDEVGGLGDLVLAADTLVFTKDNPRAAYLADGSNNDIRIQELQLTGQLGETLVRRDVTLNSLVYDPDIEVFYAVESGNNALIKFKKDQAFEYVTAFLPLASGQQAVPAGLALEPTTGNLLVALFSGQRFNGEGFDSYVPGDAKIVRVNPLTGEQQDIITGLTTAVDVSLSDKGTIFVLEYTSGIPLAKLARDFDLYASDPPPLPGGYPRFSGRLIMYAANATTPVVLLDGLDSPTNLSYEEGALYVSVGQGTPGRRVQHPDGSVIEISGEIIKLSGF